MRLVTYEVEHKGGLGVISRDGKWVYPLRSLDMDYKTMQELIEGISESEKQLLEYVSGQDPYKIRGAAPIEEVKFLAPIPNPKQDVICLGINYMAHAEESARYKKEAFGGERPYAVYFSKRVNEAVANGEGIESHSDIVTDLEYNTSYRVKVRAYKEVDGRKKYGSYSSVKSFKTEKYNSSINNEEVGKVKNVNASVTGSTVYLSWKSVPGAVKYEIQFTVPGYGGATSIWSEGPGRTISGLTNKTSNYTARVRAYKYVDGRLVPGEYSDVVRFKGK